MFFKFSVNCILLFAVSVASAAEIGRVKRASGEAHVERAGDRIAAEPGLTLDQKDVLVTGADGRISITFSDNSRFSVGPVSRIDLQEFAFNPTTEEGRFVFEVGQGSLAVISGKIAKQNPDAMQVRTPVSILGVRGTRFVLEVEPTVTLLPAVEDDPTGAIAVGLDGDTAGTVIDAPLTVAEVRSTETFTSKTDAETVDRRFGTLLAALPDPPRVYTLYFRFGTTTLTRASRSVLRRFLEDAGTRPDVSVQVTGHTDTSGTDELNDRLSRRRAELMRDRLIGRGVDPSIISAVGRGEREPLVDTGDGVPNATNRRVEVIVR